jgi:hypothetical protein
VSHADDATPDPLKLPGDDLLGAMPLGDVPAGDGAMELDTIAPASDAPSESDGDAVAEAEPTDPKAKKRAEKERKKREEQEKKRKAKEDKAAKVKEAKEDKAAKTKGKKAKQGRKEQEPAADDLSSEPEAADDLSSEPEAAVQTSGLSLLAKVRRASPYTVILAVALGSLVIAVSFLVLHLRTYDFKIHP